jgi:hypothetical protein
MKVKCPPFKTMSIAWVRSALMRDLNPQPTKCWVSPEISCDRLLILQPMPEYPPRQPLVTPSFESLELCGRE